MERRAFLKVMDSIMEAQVENGALCWAISAGMAEVTDSSLHWSLDRNFKTLITRLFKETSRAAFWMRRDGDTYEELNTRREYALMLFEQSVLQYKDYERW